MIAITSDNCVKDRLRGVTSTLGLPMPDYRCRVGALPPGAVPDSVLFLDLGSTCREPHLFLAVRGWLASHPTVTLIVFVPLLDRDAEMHAMFELASIPGTQVMTASDFARPAVWHNIVTRRTLAAHQAELRQDFLEAVARIGRPLRAECIVLRLLADAPTITDVHEAAASALARPNTLGESLRVSVWRQLRAEGQLSASRLLVVSQLVWYCRLAGLDWSSGMIAAFLGFRSPRELRLTLKRRLGVRVEVIRRVAYRDAVRWAAELCTSAQSAGEAPTLRSQLAPLVLAAVGDADQRRLPDRRPTTRATSR